MRVRAQDANGDMNFGQGGANFLVDSAAAVAQLVLTRLLLLQGEWFIDTFDGTPYATQVLGKRTDKVRDQAIRARILSTQGVLSLDSYSSTVIGRAFSIQASINTIFGPASISTGLGAVQ